MIVRNLCQVGKVKSFPDKKAMRCVGFVVLFLAWVSSSHAKKSAQRQKTERQKECEQAELRGEECEESASLPWQLVFIVLVAVPIVFFVGKNYQKCKAKKKVPEFAAARQQLRPSGPSENPGVLVPYSGKWNVVYQDKTPFGDTQKIEGEYNLVFCDDGTVTGSGKRFIGEQKKTSKWCNGPDSPDFVIREGVFNLQTKDVKWQEHGKSKPWVREVSARICETDHGEGWFPLELQGEHIRLNGWCGSLKIYKFFDGDDGDALAAKAEQDRHLAENEAQPAEYGTKVHVQPA